jgi:hypothetical protein
VKCREGPGDYYASRWSAVGGIDRWAKNLPKKENWRLIVPPVGRQSDVELTRPNNVLDRSGLLMEVARDPGATPTEHKCDTTTTGPTITGDRIWNASLSFKMAHALLNDVADHVIARGSGRHQTRREYVSRYLSHLIVEL